MRASRGVGSRVRDGWRLRPGKTRSSDVKAKLYGRDAQWAACRELICSQAARPVQSNEISATVEQWG